jgi:predicted dinucleotide-binding enzyme
MQTVNTPDSRSPCGVVGAGSIGAALGRRLAAVTASLTVEGTGDLPALMLAVRAVRALAD